MKKHLLIIVTIVALLLGLMTIIACDGLPPQIIKPGNSPSSGSNPSNNQGDELNYETLLAYAQELGFQGNLEDLINACKGAQGDSAYEIACKHYNYQGTLEDWLKSLVGAAGKDGETPFIGNNGNWWIGSVDTGVKARGEDGIDGTDGVGIESVTISADGCLSIVLTDGREIELGNIRGEVGATGQNGLDGINGKSAYEIAKDNGYEGSEEEWLQTLIGATGCNGQDGQNGQDGKDGVTPSIGENGNWWIGDIDTGVQVAGYGLDYIELDNGKYYVSVGTRTRLSRLNIPESFNGQYIIGIEEEGFLSSKALSEITLSSSIEWIGKDAFPATLTKVIFNGTCKEWADIVIEEPNAALRNAEIEFLQGGHIPNHDATCTEDSVCTRCNIILAEKLQHNYVDNVCTKCGDIILEHDILIIEKQNADYVVTGVKSTDFTKVVVPSFITRINEGVFKNCSKLTSITIPFVDNRAGVTSSDTYQYPFGYIFGTDSYSGGTATMQYYSYRINTSYTTYTHTTYYIPSSLKSITVTGDNIPYGAFYNCSGLTSITIGNGVTSISDAAFALCSGLESITVAEGNSVYHSEDNCLIDTATNTLILGCKNSIIPTDGSVTSIGRSAFSGCSGLTSITIPDSVTNIGDSAFEDCSGLTSITISDNVTSIGQGAFRGCSGLTSITIPDSVTSIGYETFWGCSGLTSIIIPDSVTSIGRSAFYGCSGLTSITIPDGVTSIGIGAFYGCSGLTSITIPDSVTSIGDCAFSGCSGLEIITVSEGNSVYQSKDNCLINTVSGALIAGCKNSVIPTDGSVTSIGNSAFYGCSGLTSITIPDGVTSIGNYAFRGCSGLTSITIPDSVTSIGYETFCGCSGLTSITIPKRVTSIGNGGFINCSGLTSIIIPDSVTSIGRSAFSGCIGLTSITIPDSVTNIGDQAFSGCSGLTSITVSEDNPNYSSQDGILYNKEKTKFIHIPKNIQGDVTIPDSITSIGSDVFSSCSGLTSITVSEDNLNYSSQDGILYNKAKTEFIHIPDNIQGDVTIPNGVTSIGNYAFAYCSGLTSITIPDCLTSIGNNAFYGCSGLKTIVIDSSMIAGLSSSASRLLSYAETVYVKDGLEAGSYITDSFTLAESSDMEGYQMYIKK